MKAFSKYSLRYYRIEIDHPQHTLLESFIIKLTACRLSLWKR